jgi:protein KRI1
MSLLSDSEASDGDQKSGHRLRINEKFAGQFERSERVKDLHRAKELLKSGDAEVLDSDSDSESETEDEDADMLSTTLDLKIIQTINSLRKRDPKIYDKSTVFFEEAPTDIPNKKDTSVVKKKKFKDIVREQILEAHSDDDGIEESSTRGVRETSTRNTLVYDAEQERIRKAFLKSASQIGNRESDEQDDDDDDDDEGEEVFQVKKKSTQELKQEEIELKKALQEMKELRSAASSVMPSKSSSNSYGNKTEMLDVSEKEGEGFLATFLEKQLWKEKASTTSRNSNGPANSEEENGENGDDEDEAELDEMERFESKYNFRFEELQDQQQRGIGAGAAMEVMGHARDVQGSLRRVDDKRKQQREARKEAKDKERRQQEAELRRLKNLKRQEVLKANVEESVLQ